MLKVKMLTIPLAEDMEDVEDLDRLDTDYDAVEIPLPLMVIANKNN